MAAYRLLELTPAPLVKSEIIDKKEGRIDTSWETVGDYIGDYIISMNTLFTYLDNEAIKRGM